MIYITEPRDFCHRSALGRRVILRLRASSQDTQGKHDTKCGSCIRDLAGSTLGRPCSVIYLAEHIPQEETT